MNGKRHPTLKRILSRVVLVGLKEIKKLKERMGR